MGKRKVSMPALSMLILVLSLSFMSSLGADNDADQTNASGQTLRIGLIPADDMQALLRAFDPVQKYLETTLSMKIQAFTATDYTSVVEAMRSRKIDVAYFGPFSYILAAKRANAEAIVTGGTPEGKVDSYYSYIVTGKKSGLKSIDDLKKNTSKISFAWVDVASTSGNLVPRGYLMSIGINPDKDFKASTFAGGHDAVGLAVKSGRVAAGAMNDVTYNRMIESGALKADEIVVLWKSDPIPKSPIAVRGDMDPALKMKIQQAFVDMPKKDPEAFKVFEAMWEKNTVYIPINDSTYEYIREMGKAQGYI
jgi:phosphonate transport system substrate-binding protein